MENSFIRKTCLSSDVFSDKPFTLVFSILKTPSISTFDHCTGMSRTTKDLFMFSLCLWQINSKRCFNMNSKASWQIGDSVYHLGRFMAKPGTSPFGLLFAAIISRQTSNRQTQTNFLLGFNIFFFIKFDWNRPKCHVDFCFECLKGTLTGHTHKSFQSLHVISRRKVKRNFRCNQSSWTWAKRISDRFDATEHWSMNEGEKSVQIIFDDVG